jgi:putative addiction module component (TIGR02574 family)
LQRRPSFGSIPVGARWAPQLNSSSLDVGLPVAHAAVNPKFHSMAPTHVDISQLTVDQRLQLVEELWESLSATHVPLTPAQEREIDRREALHRGQPNRGRPWRDALDEIQRRRS